MKGVAYTSFAILASITLLVVFTFPSEYSVYQQGFDLDSSERMMFTQNALENNVDDITELNAENHFKMFNQEILNSGFLNQPESEYESSYQDSIEEIKGEIDTLEAGYNHLNNLNVENIGLEFESAQKFYSYEINYFLEQNKRSINKSEQIIHSFDLEGADPLLTLNTGQSKDFDYDICDRGVSQGAEGTSDTGAVLNGEFVDNPGRLSNINARESKILVVDRTEPYEDDLIEDFRAVVTQNETWEGDTEFVNGVDLFDINFQDYNSAIIDSDRVYFTNLFDLVEEECYISELPDRSAPSPYDRMENKTNNFREDSIARFVRTEDKENLEDSNIGFLTFTDSDAVSRRIRGYSTVQNGEGIQDDEFRLPESFLEEWNMDDLIIQS